MQNFYNLTPAEQYKYTGSITEWETEDLLRHSAALEKLYDLFWDMENSDEEYSESVTEFLGGMRKIFDEAGI